jgi:uncharacterized membrane protein
MLHKDHKPTHPKQDFQVERLAFFSDAIFAIAITLLIIEFKIPHFNKDSSYHEVWEQLVDLKYNLLAFVLSFVLISNYWIRHHFLFKHIHNYNKKTLIANMIILMPIVFFPFTTSFFAESISNENIIILGLRIFLLNHILANIALYYFYWLAIIKHKDLSLNMIKIEQIEFNIDILVPVISFAFSLILSFFFRNINIVYIPLFVGLAMRRLLKFYYKRKHKNSNHNI